MIDHLVFAAIFGLGVLSGIGLLYIWTILRVRPEYDDAVDIGDGVAWAVMDRDSAGKVRIVSERAFAGRRRSAWVSARKLRLRKRSRGQHTWGVSIEELREMEDAA